MDIKKTNFVGYKDVKKVRLLCVQYFPNWVDNVKYFDKAKFRKHAIGV